MTIGIITPFHNNFGGGEVYIQELSNYNEKIIIYTSDIEVYKKFRYIEIPIINSHIKLWKSIYSIIKLLKKNKVKKLILNDVYISNYGFLFRMLGIKTYSLIHSEIKGIFKCKNIILLNSFIKWIKILLIQIGSFKILTVNKTNLKYFNKEKIKNKK